MKLQLGDVTGTVEAVIWDGVDELFECCRPGGVVRVVGNFSVDQRYGSSLTVRSLRAAEPGEYEPAMLEEAPIPARRPDGGRPAQPGRHDAAIRTCASCSTRCFADDSEIWRRYHDAPAAKYYHQAYRHGLLEHCLSVAQGVSALSATFPGIDRDVAVTGALLHDIGKIEAYTAENGAIELTDAGKLQGEIAARLLPRATR